MKEREEIIEKNRTVYRLAGVLMCIDADRVNAETLADYVRGCASAIQDLSGDVMEYLDNMAD